MKFYMGREKKMNFMFLIMKVMIVFLIIIGAMLIIYTKVISTKLDQLNSEETKENNTRKP